MGKVGSRSGDRRLRWRETMEQAEVGEGFSRQLLWGPHDGSSGHEGPQGDPSRRVTAETAMAVGELL